VPRAVVEGAYICRQTAQLKTIDPLGSFFIGENMPDRPAGYWREYYKNHKEQRKLATKKYNERNREKVKANRKKYRENNKEKIRETQYAYRKKVREWFIEFKKTHPCEICGESHPACISFHHINPEEKEIDLAHAYSSYSIKRIKEEIKKCQIVCENCHRKIHYELKQKNLINK
jgi:hypothetical protein